MSTSTTIVFRGGRKHTVADLMAMSDRAPWPAAFGAPPVGGETRIHEAPMTISADSDPAADIEAAALAAATLFRMLGILVGERPVVTPEPFEVRPNGDRRYRIRTAITAPPGWPAEAGEVA